MKPGEKKARYNFEFPKKSKNVLISGSVLHY